MNLTDIKKFIDKYSVYGLTDKTLVNSLTGSKIETDDDDFYSTLAYCGSIKEISLKTGMTETQATKLMLGIELGRRFCESKAFDKIRFEDVPSVGDYLKTLMNNLQQEHFLVLCLNNRNKLIKRAIISKGSVRNTIVEPREVFKEAIVNNASAIIVAHNHPSGDVEPSQEDDEVTRMLVRSGKLLHIPVIDHFIIGGGKYYSFKEADKI